MCIVDEFVVDVEKIPYGREPGISGFMRVKNEGEYLAQTVETWLPFLDELVIIYNGCTDDSESIIGNYAEKFKKIKAFHYLPEVYPMGSKKYMDTPVDSIHSLINYTNYALSKTTREICAIVDADDIAAFNRIRKIISIIRRTPLKKEDFWMFSGINLWRDGDRIMIQKNDPFCGMGGDHGFFRVSEKTHFIGGFRCDWMDRYDGPRYNLGFMYYHAKFLKRDRGVSNYQLDNNPDSMYADETRKALSDTDLISFEELVDMHGDTYPELKELPSPSDVIRLS